MEESPLNVRNTMLPRKQIHFMEYMPDGVNVEMNKTKGVTKFKSGWSSFLNYFKQGNKTARNKTIVKREYDFKTNKLLLQNDFVNTLNEFHEDLAMAISMPEGLNGIDLKIAVELQALDAQTTDNYDACLNLIRESQSKTIFSGILQVPSNTTLLQVATMPLYFIKDGNKVETIVKPLRGSVPSGFDKSMIVSDIYLKIIFQNLNKVKKMQTVETLPFAFIPKEKLGAEFIDLKNSIKSTQYSLQMLTADVTTECNNMLDDLPPHIIEAISGDDCELLDPKVEDNAFQQSTETETNTMSSVASCEIELNDTATQYSENSLLHDGGKDIEMQKSFMYQYLEKSDFMQPQVVDATANCPSNGMLDTTSKSVLTDAIPEAPQNTPIKMQLPKYTLQYDESQLMNWMPINKDDVIIKVINTSPSQFGDATSSPSHIKADIDRTLTLLETAKSKLLGYLEKPYPVIDVNQGATNTTTQKKPASKTPPLPAGYLNTATSMDIYSICHESNMKNETQPIDEEKTSISKTHQQQPSSQTQRSPSSEYNRIYDQVRSTRTAKQQKFFLGETKNEKLKTDVRNIYQQEVQSGSNSLVLLDDEFLYRTASQSERDELFKERYAGDSKKLGKTLTQDVVENDINVMMDELLFESENIKELALKCIDSRCKIQIEDESHEDVDFVLDLLLDNVEKVDQDNVSIQEIDPPKYDKIMPTPIDIALPTLSNNIKDGDSTAIMEIKQTGNGYDLPLVTVRRHTACKNYQLYDRGENLCERLERGSLFLSQIYNEMCIFNTSHLDAEPDDNEGEDSKAGSIKQQAVLTVEPSTSQHLPNSVGESLVVGVPRTNEGATTTTTTTTTKTTTTGHDETHNDNNEEIHHDAPFSILKKAAKLEENPSKSVMVQSDVQTIPMHSTTEEEVQFATSVLNVPGVPETFSKHSTSSRRSAKQPSLLTSSSSEEIYHTRNKRHLRKSPSTTSTANSKPLSRKASKSVAGSSFTSSSSFPVDTSDYDADMEQYSILLPDFKFQYASLEELNNKEEIAQIEENVKCNEELNEKNRQDDKTSEVEYDVRSYGSIPIDSESMSYSLSSEILND